MDDMEKAENKYFEMLAVMGSFSISKMTDKQAKDYFRAGEKSLEVLPGTIQYWIKTYGGTKGIPPTIPCRDELPDIYMRFGKWDEAIEAVHKACQANAMSTEEQKNKVWWITGCKTASNAVLDYLKEFPGALQKDMYVTLPHINKDCLKWFLRASKQIDKIKFKNTNKLYIKGKKPADANIDLAINENKSEKLKAQRKIALQQNIDFPEWYVSISFGKSSSRNFPQALALAKMAPQYIENNVEGNILHQAIYSNKPSEYLQFVKLYELINGWKSCFVVINGQLVDRKIIGGINYCYGDKCRSGNPNFCYGASYMTENPFGCHRIQISAYNNPWWSFGRFDTKGVWHVDKESMLKRIMGYSEPYRLCPEFSLDRAMDGLKKLPDIINPNIDSDWMRTGERIAPSSNPNAITYTIKLEVEPKPPGKKRNINSKTGGGCLTFIVFTILIFWLIVLAIF